MAVAEKIKNLLIRIERVAENGQNEPIGSGVLWRPPNKSEYDYIFTAAHVVNDESKELEYKISYIGKNDETFSQKIEPQNICIHLGFKEDEINGNHKDVAVIRCEKLNIEVKSFDFKNLDDLMEGTELTIKGFPKSIYNQESLALSTGTIPTSYGGKDDNLQKFTYTILPKAQINPVDRNEELRGYSGAGVFLESEEGLFLIGLHSYGIGSDTSQAMLCGMYAGLIIDVCKNQNWDVASFGSEFDGCLEDSIEFFEEEVKNEAMTEIMYNEIIANDYTGFMQSNICGCSKECTMGVPPQKCPYFRGNLLIFLTIFKYMDEKMDLSNPVIENKGIQHPIVYICSEGVDVKSRVKITHFIESLKKDYLCKNVVQEDSIIIWVSKEATKGKLSFNKQEFKNILPDIKKGVRRNARSIGRGGEFNIFKGHNIPEEISIIHVNEIKDGLDKMGSDEGSGQINDMICQLI